MSKLKLLILEKGFKQFAVAKKMGVSENTLSRIVTGRKVANDEEVTALAKALRVSEKRVREALPAPVGC